MLFLNAISRYILYEFGVAIIVRRKKINMFVCFSGKSFENEMSGCDDSIRVQFSNTEKKTKTKNKMEKKTTEHLFWPHFRCTHSFLVIYCLK